MFLKNDSEKHFPDEELVYSTRDRKIELFSFAPRDGNKRRREKFEVCFVGHCPSRSHALSLMHIPFKYGYCARRRGQLYTPVVISDNYLYRDWDVFSTSCMNPASAMTATTSARMNSTHNGHNVCGLVQQNNHLLCLRFDARDCCLDASKTVLSRVDSYMKRSAIRTP